MAAQFTTTPRRRARPVVVAGLAVVAVLTLCAVVGLVAAVGHRADPAPRPPASPTATARPAAPPDTAAPSPGSVFWWVSVAGARVPVAADGPHDTSDGLARGFAHTPLGAVLAAVHISVRLSPQVGPQVFEATCHQQVIGPDAAALLQHVEDDYQTARTQLGVPYGQPAGQLYSTPIGYRVQLTGEQATVGLLIQGPGTSGSVLVTLSVRMQWTSGDWALVAPSGGSWDNAAVVVTDTSGYTTFGGS